MRMDVEKPRKPRRVEVAVTILQLAAAALILIVNGCDSRKTVTQAGYRNFSRNPFQYETAEDEGLQWVQRDLDEALGTDWSPVDAAKATAYERRLREEAAEAATETLAETVRKLRDSKRLVDEKRDAVLFLCMIHREPRAQKLMNVALNGTEDERRMLLRLVEEMCRIYVEELPDFVLPGQPYTLSAMHHDGGVAYPYLLTMLDDNAATLDLIVRMHLRNQSAIRKHLDLVGVSAAPDEWVLCDHGITLAFAARHFLSLYVLRGDLGSKANQEQQRVLAAFRAYVESDEGGLRDLYENQNRILRFATDFVEAGVERIPRQIMKGK